MFLSAGSCHLLRLIQNSSPHFSFRFDMKYTKEQLEDLQVKMDACQQRINALLVNISKHNKNIDILQTELVGERELLKKFQQEFCWLEYQREFS